MSAKKIHWAIHKKIFLITDILTINKNNLIMGKFDGSFYFFIENLHIIVRC